MTEWTQEEGIALCRLIHELPSQQYHCHVGLTGGLLYKDGPRKDCDLVIIVYQRGDTKGEHPAVDWPGLWTALAGLGLEKMEDHGYVKKCTYQGKRVDILDPADDGIYPIPEAV